jgi:hypothetical protein
VEDKEDRKGSELLGIENDDKDKPADDLDCESNNDVDATDHRPLNLPT